MGTLLGSGGKSVVGCLFVPLEKFDRKEIRVPLTMGNFWNNHSNPFLLAVL